MGFLKMKSLTNIKNAIAVSLILFGIILAIKQSPSNIIDDKNVVVLNIEKPSDKVVELVMPVAKLITDPTDRAKLAIFNQEFANRVIKYDADNQQINDIYVLAASHFFGDTIVDKYKDLDTKLVELLESIVGNDNHKLTIEEKRIISDNFLGLAWSLAQKR